MYNMSLLSFPSYNRCNTCIYNLRTCLSLYNVTSKKNVFSIVTQILFSSTYTYQWPILPTNTHEFWCNASEIWTLVKKFMKIGWLDVIILNHSVQLLDSLCVWHSLPLLRSMESELVTSFLVLYTLRTNLSVVN